MKVIVERLGHLGDGIAPGPIFVRRSLPGEEVEGDVVDSRMDAPKIVTPSVDRRRASCQHYNACGGCSLMHASDGFVADWKINVIKAALAAQGLEAFVRSIDTSPERSRRRATLSGRRTKKGAIVGFHGRASDTLVDVFDCAILHPALQGCLPTLRQITEMGTSRKAELALNLTLTDGGLDLAVFGGKPMDPTLFSGLAALADSADLARLSWDGEPIVMRRAAEKQFGLARVSLPPGAFLQATDAGEAALLAGVREIVGPAKHVVDLFAGAGTFSLPLAETAEVHAVEAERTMLDALSKAANHTQGLHKVTTETRDLFRRPLMPDELSRFEAIVIDPPRAGAEAQINEIVASKVETLAYVSCNPVTFARDAKILVDGGFSLAWIAAVDQFRWSTHIELVARFLRIRR